jgi:hypothetical protein
MFIERGVYGVFHLDMAVKPGWSLAFERYCMVESDEDAAVA